MIKFIQYEAGQELTFKKQHPCGGNVWVVLKPGVDMKLQCKTCNRVVILPRIEVTKKVKG